MDQILEGILSQNTKQDLLKPLNLTQQKSMDICRTAEKALASSQDMGSEVAQEMKIHEASRAKEPLWKNRMPILWLFTCTQTQMFSLWQIVPCM